MSIKANAKDLVNWYGFTENFDMIPDKCPICNYAVEPIPITHYFKDAPPGGDYDICVVVCACPRQECRELYIVRYVAERRPPYKTKYCLKRYSPFTYEKKELDEIINNVSPSFARIYNESANAEKCGLNEIAGVGYRKALEFLIKDYCISTKPDDIHKIKEMALAKCISEYVGHDGIKVCAERAVWIGNDETHYVRLWEDKDIDNMKELLEMMINWILLDMRTTHYKENMTSKKKK